MSLHVRLFAKLDSGLLAIDPAPQTSGLAVQRDRLGQVERVMQIAQRYEELPAKHRQGQWGRVVEERRSTVQRAHRS